MKTTALMLTTAALSLSQMSQASSIDYARVIEAEPVYKTIKHREPVEQCWMETHYRPVSAPSHTRHSPHHAHADDKSNSYTPTIIGGLLGGAVGNKVGNNKSAKKVGAVAGAVLGASLANDFMRWRQGKQSDYKAYNARHDYAHAGGGYGHTKDGYSYTRDDYRYANQRESYQQERCKTEYEVRYEERLIGYDVTYKYNGEHYQTRTANHPGSRLKVAVNVTPVE